MNDHSYRLSLIFAVTLHVVLVFFLLVKFTSSHSVAFNSSSNFINAVVISERDFNNQKETVITKPIHQQQVLKPQTKEQIKTILQKNLLAEQAKEMAELRKERQVYRAAVKKQKQQSQETQKMLHDQAVAEQQQLASEQEQIGGSQSQGEVDKYKAMIVQAISSQWIVPDGVDKNATCQLLVNVGPGGVVLDVQLLSSSGNSILDRSAQTAVLKASPLPVPEDQGLFNNFRTIKLTVKPEGVIEG